MRRWLVWWSVLVLFVFAWSGRAHAQQRCPFTANGMIDVGDPAQTGRLQNGQPSACATPKTVPAIQQAKQTFRYDAYTLRNRTGAAACVSITVTPSAGTVHSAAYLGSFDPANPQANYLGDSGVNSTGAPLTYEVNVPSLADVVVVVHEIGHAGATYSLDATGCGSIVVTSITPNAGPEAGGMDVTIKGSGFLVAPTVAIGATASNVTVVDEGTITARTAAGSGTVDVVVTNADATTSTLVSAYTYVPPSQTTIALASSVNPSVFGQSVALTATATSTGGIPTGDIVFKEGATTLGTVALDGTGKAVLTTASLTVGVHKIKATYAGNVTFVGNESPELTQTVSIASTTTTIASSLNPSKFGDVVTFTATVAATPPATGVATGSVTFTDNGLLIGTATLDGAGKALFATSGLAAGVPHAVVATYAGATNYQTSASAALTQVVDADSDAGADSGTPSSGGADSGAPSGSTSSGGATDAGATDGQGGETGGGGCDCRTAAGGSSGLASVALGMAVLGIVTRRKRR